MSRRTLLRRGRSARDGVQNLLQAVNNGSCFGGISPAELRANFVLQGFQLVHAWHEVTAIKGSGGGLQTGDEWPLVLAPEVGAIDEIYAFSNPVGGRDDTDVGFARGHVLSIAHRQNNRVTAQVETIGHH